MYYRLERSRAFFIHFYGDDTEALHSQSWALRMMSEVTKSEL